MERREAIGKFLKYGTAFAGLNLLNSGALFAQAAESKLVNIKDMGLAYSGNHEIKPLPFNPAKLEGISEKVILSHHKNNYGGAVKRLNQIEKQIAGLAADVPPFQYGALKREELIATNSKILHELYFANLGGNENIKGTISDLIKQRYKNYESWKHDFKMTAKSLGGGSGWVILEYNPNTGYVHNYWSGDHTNNLAGGIPLLVLDMYEHSYHMDYGSDSAKYIDAFFKNINWSEVNTRIANIRLR